MSSRMRVMAVALVAVVVGLPAVVPAVVLAAASKASGGFGIGPAEVGLWLGLIAAWAVVALTWGRGPRDRTD